MLDAYDGSLPHPRSRWAFQNDRGRFVDIDDGEAAFRPADCLYRFNSLGFRSDEFDPSARLKIFVAGCSYTFGLGIAAERTWPALLKKRLADKLGVPPDQANLQNFSQIGASNGYIARTIIRQCERVRPDLAVIAFTHRERIEYLAPDVTRNLGLWDLDDPDIAAAAPSIRYFGLYNTESASLDLLKNMLMVQWAMARRKIPYLMLWMNRTNIDQAPIGELAPLRRLREMIDPGRFSLRCLLEPTVMVDSNVGDRHPGPRSHANFAPLVFDAVDMSVPKQVPAPPETARQRILALGDERAPSCGASVCSDESCPCRRDLARHGVVGKAIDRPLGGQASNDRIVRALLEQCSRWKPDFVFLGFSARRSRELFHGQALVELELASSAGSTPEMAELADAYRRFATDELHDLDVLRNVLVAQEFLEMQGVPYRMSIPAAFNARTMSASAKHPVLQSYASLVNPASLCQGQAWDAGAIDPPGAGSSIRSRTGALSRAIVTRLKKRLGKSRTEDPNIYPLW
jgi:hypothetical protein